LPKITTDDFNTLMAEEMPWAVEAGMTLETIGADRATMRLEYNDAMLRPGGTMSGPTMMALRRHHVCRGAGHHRKLCRESRAQKCRLADRRDLREPSDPTESRLRIVRASPLRSPARR